MKKANLVLLAVVLFAFGIYSCEERGKDIPQISTFSSDESHYHGRNCVDCHYSEGSGYGWFTVAGSISGNPSQTTVELYTSPDGGGTRVGRIEVDRLGNFYTTDRIDFGSGLYVTVRSPGEVEHMEDKIIFGQCNLCHGSLEEPIEID